MLGAKKGAKQARSPYARIWGSRWVHHVPEADREVVHAAPVLNALIQGRPYASLWWTLTAFTHPRRLAILRAMPVATTPRFSELVSATGISGPALSRHLAKLQRNNEIEAVNEGGRTARSDSPLTILLLAEIRRP
jgi:hypothetical protein